MGCPCAHRAICRPERPLTTPVQVQATDLGLPPYTSLASSGEDLRALDPAGGLWRPGVLGWERMPSALEQGGASGPKTMWFNDSELCLMAGEDVWVQSDQGWAEGSPFWDGPNAPRAVNMRQGTFFADSSSCESSMVPVCFQAAEALPAPTSITWSPGGDVVRFGNNITTSWHPEQRTVRLEPSAMGVHNAGRTSWLWLNPCRGDSLAKNPFPCFGTHDLGRHPDRLVWHVAQNGCQQHLPSGHVGV